MDDYQYWLDYLVGLVCTAGKITKKNNIGVFANLLLPSSIKINPNNKFINQ
jgi:hypothetical protein